MNRLEDKSLNLQLGWILLLSGATGVLASFVITLDKIALLQNPNFVPACSLNPLISCGIIIKSPQAAAFGFPNSLLGLIGFTVLAMVGMTLLVGVTLPRLYLLLINLGALLGVGFVHWLIIQAVFEIQALCLWCLAIWVVMILIFWATTIYNMKCQNLPKWDWLLKHQYSFLLSWYLIIVGLVLWHFRLQL